MRVPDLDWPADLFTDVPVATAFADMSAAPPFWAEMRAPAADLACAAARRQAEWTGDLVLA